MNDARRAKNCEKCNFRKMQDKYLGRVFDYRNCPCACRQNKIDHVGFGLTRKKQPL